MNTINPVSVTQQVTNLNNLPSSGSRNVQNQGSNLSEITRRIGASVAESIQDQPLSRKKRGIPPDWQPSQPEPKPKESDSSYVTVEPVPYKLRFTWGGSSASEYLDAFARPWSNAAEIGSKVVSAARGDSIQEAEANAANTKEKAKPADTIITGAIGFLGGPAGRAFAGAQQIAGQVSDTLETGKPPEIPVDPRIFGGGPNLAAGRRPIIPREEVSEPTITPESTPRVEGEQPVEIEEEQVNVRCRRTLGGECSPGPSTSQGAANVRETAQTNYENEFPINNPKVKNTTDNLFSKTDPAHEGDATASSARQELEESHSTALVLHDGSPQAKLFNSEAVSRPDSAGESVDFVGKLNLNGETIEVGLDPFQPPKGLKDAPVSDINSSNPELTKWLNGAFRTHTHNIKGGQDIMGTTGILDVTGFSQEKVDALLKVINETKPNRYENPSNPEDIENVENFAVVDRQKGTVEWHITEDQLTNIWESKVAKSQEDEDGFGGLFGDGE